MNNPLASSRQSAPQDHPMMRHAQMWQHAHSMEPDDLAQHIQTSDYSLPIFAALLSKKNVTAKDVIKATSGAVADGKISPSQGVATITNMPADADAVRPWLQKMFSDGLSLAIHAKAAALKQAQPQAQQPQGQPMPAAPMPGGMPQ